MKRRREGITPSFPAFAAQLSPRTSVEESPAEAIAQPNGGTFLPGFALACKDHEPKRLPASRRQAIYNAYICSPGWQQISAPIRRRAAGHCERCGRPYAQLQVHHRTYARFGGRELAEDLEALCEPCHAAADTERRQERDIALEVAVAAAAEDIDDTRLDGWMRAKHGEDWLLLDGDTMEREEEKFRTYCDRKSEEGL